MLCWALVVYTHRAMCNVCLQSKWHILRFNKSVFTVCLLLHENIRHTCYVRLINTSRSDPCAINQFRVQRWYEINMTNNNKRERNGKKSSSDMLAAANLSRAHFHHYVLCFNMYVQRIALSFIGKTATARAHLLLLFICHQAIGISTWLLARIPFNARRPWPKNEQKKKRRINRDSALSVKMFRAGGNAHRTCLLSTSITPSIIAFSPPWFPILFFSNILLSLAYASNAEWTWNGRSKQQLQFCIFFYFSRLRLQFSLLICEWVCVSNTPANISRQKNKKTFIFYHVEMF